MLHRKVKGKFIFYWNIIAFMHGDISVAVQAEKKEADTDLDRELDTGLEKEADSDVDFDTERKEMLGYLTKENLFQIWTNFQGGKRE